MALAPGPGLSLPVRGLSASVLSLLVSGLLRDGFRLSGGVLMVILWVDVKWRSAASARALHRVQEAFR